MPKDEMIRFLNTWFVDPTQVGEGVPCLYRAHTPNSHVPFYVLYKIGENTSEVNVKGLLTALRQQARNSDDIQIPLVALIPEHNIYKAGVLVYWDFGRWHYNKDINKQPLNSQTLLWLEMQICAQRMHIRSIPMEYVGFIKTITLNTNEVIDAEIIYWRKLTDSYKVIPYKPKDEQDRFYRILKGTPENEYPKDILDEVILQQVQSAYPNAKIKTKSLLFDNDLLNFRLLKDKIKDRLIFGVHYYQTMTLHSVQSFEIFVECYYHHNFYKRCPLNQLDQYFIGNEKKFQQIRSLYETTSKPISEFII